MDGLTPEDLILYDNNLTQAMQNRRSLINCHGLPEPPPEGAQKQPYEDDETQDD